MLIPTFSLQGDGNSELTTGRSAHSDLDVDPYLFPARGRKLDVQLGLKSNEEILLIPTFSPQGDGNYPGGVLGALMGRVDPYLFPARGRKLVA